MKYKKIGKRYGNDLWGARPPHTIILYELKWMQLSSYSTTTFNRASSTAGKSYNPSILLLEQSVHNAVLYIVLLRYNKWINIAE